VAAYSESEQVTGFYTMMENNFRLPFEHKHDWIYDRSTDFNFPARSSGFPTLFAHFLPVLQYRYAVIHSAPFGSGAGHGSSGSEIRCLLLFFRHTATSWSSFSHIDPFHGYRHAQKLRLDGRCDLQGTEADETEEGSCTLKDHFGIKYESGIPSKVASIAPLAIARLHK